MLFAILYLLFEFFEVEAFVEVEVGGLEGFGDLELLVVEVGDVVLAVLGRITKRLLFRHAG